MPSKRMLEDYLDGMNGNLTVYFDSEKGKFVRVKKK